MRTTRAWRLRRLVWRTRRNAPRVVAQPLSLVLRSQPPREPILIIGCPRSGTSVLLQLFLRSGELASVQSEGHILWDPFHPKRRRESDALGATDVSSRERAYVYTAIRLFARARFVDKTPENSLRVPYLESMFPDARFVFLRRRGADNVNSLIEGWRARPRFVTYRLPERLDGLGALSGNIWSFALVPSWRELRHAPLEEICARQYSACNEAALDALDRIDPSRRIDAAYEDLVADPVGVARRLFDALGLTFNAAAESYAARLHETPGPTSLTPPRPDKWREQNREAVERILPFIEPTERRLGYPG